METTVKEKTTPGLIYRHIVLYRMAMNILYGFTYKKRFEFVFQTIGQYKPRSILELCFGDTLIASYCQAHHIHWQGIDSNEYFVKRALRNGFQSRCEDLLGPAQLAPAEMIIMVGSLYHFQKEISSLLSRMIHASPRIIISEPVINYSNQNNWLGWLARKASNAGHGEEAFRYTAESLQTLLEEQAKLLKFSFRIIGYHKKDLILLIEKSID